MNDNYLKKVSEDKKIISTMISIYCNGNSHKANEENKVKDDICPNCKRLQEYAYSKIDKCPKLKSGKKAICGTCKNNCYMQDDELSNMMKAVMKYSGPRMILKHPLMTIKHAL